MSINKRLGFETILTSLRSYRFRSLLVRYFLVLAAMVLVPLVASIVTLATFYQRAIVREIGAAHEDNLHRIRQTVDYIIREADLLAVRLAMNSDVREFVLNYSRERPGYATDYSQRVFDLLIGQTGPYVRSIYVYTDISGAVATSEGAAMPLQLLEDKEWLVHDLLPYRETHHLWHRKRRDAQDTTLLSVFCNVLYSRRMGCVIVNLSLDQIAATMSRRADSHVSYIIRDERGEILIETGDSDTGVVASELFSVSVESEFRPWQFTVVVGELSSHRSIRLMRGFTATLLAGLVLVVIAVSFMISLRIYTPFHTIRSVLEQPEHGEEPHQVRDRIRSDEIRFIVDNLIQSMDSRKRLESELFENMHRLQQAQIVALQAQINPHFLRNTLDSASYLSMELSGGPNKATEAIQALSAMLDISLRTETDLIPLRREIEHAQHYVRILELQYGDMFQVEWSIGEVDLEARIPRITLQPLIENAIYHGIKPTMRPGSVSITAVVQNRGLAVTVADDGGGMQDSTLLRLRDEIRDPTLHVAQHLGLGNLALRYGLIYGTRARMQIQSEPESGTTVGIWMPVPPAPA